MRNEDFTIQLTEDRSYDVHLQLGQGSFSIGTLDMDAKKFDILVDKDAPLRWKAFEEMSDEGSWWPRFFYYDGNDTSFFDWSKTRPIETFNWTPQKAIHIKSTDVDFRHLAVNVGTEKIDLDLRGDIHTFIGRGKLNNLHLHFGNKIPSLSFTPTLSKDETTAYQLPIYENLTEAKHLDISGGVIGQAFDCESVLQFPNLTSLSLSGNLTNLSCLAKLDKLKSLAIRFVPNLEGFPSLSVWKNLESFIGWNIEEVEGKRLKKELKLIESDKHRSVSQLRKAIWFATEYGMPFSAWEKRNEKHAVKSFKAALKQIKKSTNIDELREAITTFIESINALANIETSEREDIGTAVELLLANTKLEIDPKVALQWFDEVRDF